MQHHDCGMPACGLRSEQITHQLGPAVSAGKVHCLRLCPCTGDNKASDAAKDDCSGADKTKKFPPPHAAPLIVARHLKSGVRIAPRRRTPFGYVYTGSARRSRVRALTGAERLESDDGVGVLDARNHLHPFVDEMADVGVVVDVELYQQIVIARGGIDLGGDLGLGERVGDGIGLAELAFELDKEWNHRCRLRERRIWVQYSAQELAGNNRSR